MGDTKSIAIRVYLLERTGRILPEEHAYCLAAASSERAAREIANSESGSEGYVWTDESLTKALDLGSAVDDVYGALVMAKEGKRLIVEDSGKGLSGLLYLLERTENVLPDEYVKCVVSASSEKAARGLAHVDSGSDGYVWTDGSLVRARELGEAASGIYGTILLARE